MTTFFATRILPLYVMYITFGFSFFKVCKAK
jgi:hypothetical protein